MPPRALELRVGDLPTRIFHFAFALTVVAAIACAKLGAGLMSWHVRLGIVALAATGAWWLLALAQA